SESGPYGTISALSVTRYARQAALALVDRDIKLLVLACNSVSAVAVEPLQVALTYFLVVGVVEPGGEASCKATRNGHIG
ncbi:glutamate racemase, partial [Neptunomonas phycophila]|nr:glutamate racemase [Neptunomonas phycophila]